MRTPHSRTLRQNALSIFEAALAAADPAEAVRRRLERVNFSRFRRIYVIGAGKAGASMAQAAERFLGRRIAAGLINVKYGHTARLRRIELNESGHPVPDERGVEGARRILEIAGAAGREDLVVCLISGGASALLPLPAPPLTLGDMQETTRLLLGCGAAIHEFNAVRKHLSAVTGGQLARAAAPARVEALLLSDVIGDSLDVIGSGPTAPDSSTFRDASDILCRYGLMDRVPESVSERLARGGLGEIPETPKPGDPLFARVRNTIVGSNRLALRAAARQARALGYRTLILASEVQGETREVARMHAAIAREIVNAGQPLRPPACVITGGETTVTLRGSGLGGRNQEFALAAALDIAGLPDVAVFSAGTDGTDGPTDAAGAFADGETLARKPDARRYLDENDSYRYFNALGDLAITGPTNTNVMDVRLILAGIPAPRPGRRPRARRPTPAKARG
ncbi:MAG: glycerate kinase [Acidobacteriia bacterium]|nr:glycerate kinase [Terriglobia bacterium]